eukprot:scaffold36275_cov154-Isochrysis_galbana.AAC.21
MARSLGARCEQPHGDWSSMKLLADEVEGALDGRQHSRHCGRAVNANGEEHTARALADRRAGRGT